MERRTLARNGEMGKEKGYKMTDPKTGDFHIRAGVELGASEQEKEWARMHLLRGVAERLERTSVDNREYIVLLRLGKWERSEEFGQHEVLSVDVGVYVAGVSATEVGDCVFNLPIEVPDDLLQVVLPGGYVFERDEPGWRRVE